MLYLLDFHAQTNRPTAHCRLHALRCRARVSSGTSTSVEGAADQLHGIAGEHNGLPFDCSQGATTASAALWQWDGGDGGRGRMRRRCEYVCRKLLPELHAAVLWRWRVELWNGRRMRARIGRGLRPTRSGHGRPHSGATVHHRFVRQRVRCSNLHDRYGRHHSLCRWLLLAYSSGLPRFCVGRLILGHIHSPRRSYGPSPCRRRHKFGCIHNAGGASRSAAGLRKRPGGCWRAV